MSIDKNGGLTEESTNRRILLDKSSPSMVQDLILPKNQKQN